MKEEKIIYRHGEIGLSPIKKLPESLSVSESKTIMQGSHDNSHCIDKGQIYFKDVDTYTFGYLSAKDTKLKHYEHGNTCSVCGFDKLGNANVCPSCNTDFVRDKKFRLTTLPNGVYELRKQNEIINSQLKPVID